MSSSPPPTKPPRGVKQGKETSGLLMSVIRTLSASETNEQREKERAKLEKEYKKSDAKLDELVAQNATEIMEVMQKFSQAQAALSAWGQRSDAATARLGACRQLLRLRRDDLRRLWTDARASAHALEMLTDIELVASSEHSFSSAASSGLVLSAAHTLRGALAAAASLHAPALHAAELRLQMKKQELVDTIVSSLNAAVYRGQPALSRRPSARRRAALLIAELTKPEEVTDAYLQDITPEFEASLTEEDKTFETTVMISLEALGVLDSLKEASEKFKVQIQGQLLEVIDTVSRRIIAEGDTDIEGDECERDVDIQINDSATESDRPLTRLVQCLSDEFRANAIRNNRLLQLWRAALQRHKMSDSCLHTEQHYWSAVQQVMQLLLTEYLDISWLAVKGRSAAPPPDLRLPDYFAKKRVPRKPARLFTLPPVTSSTQPSARRLARAPLVASPGAARLPAVLPPLHELASLAARPGTECSLKEFITNYVRECETERLSTEGRTAIDNAMKEASAWRERAPPPGGREHRLIFTCCISSWEAIASVAKSAKRCGSFGGSEAARAILPCAAALCAHARAAHSRMVPVTSRAARWLSDDDIVRFLQSLPNWRVATAAEPVAEDKALEEELHQAYSREAEILGSSLRDGAVARAEIIAEVAALADIALLCESMAWISSNVKSLPSLMSGIKLGDKLQADLAAAAAVFDEIQHKCLLLLHLEMRIQCFHYLGGPGGGAAPLAAALTSFHEHASPVLSLASRQYIMNGIGEMMSAGIVWCCVEERDANTRLPTLRHCLAALSLPHRGLTSATRYIQLLADPPEEIIKSVREKGAQFSELEYLNAFKIIGAKRGLSQADMKGYLKQLSSALGHIGVTV